MSLPRRHCLKTEEAIIILFTKNITWTAITLQRKIDSHKFSPSFMGMQLSDFGVCFPSAGILCRIVMFINARPVFKDGSLLAEVPKARVTSAQRYAHKQRDQITRKLNSDSELIYRGKWMQNAFPACSCSARNGKSGSSSPLNPDATKKPTQLFLYQLSFHTCGNKATWPIRLARPTPWLLNASVPSDPSEGRTKQNMAWLRKSCSIVPTFWIWCVDDRQRWRSSYLVRYSDTDYLIQQQTETNAKGICFGWTCLEHLYSNGSSAM